MLLGLQDPDPNPLVTGTDSDPAPDPDPFSEIMLAKQDFNTKF